MTDWFDPTGHPFYAVGLCDRCHRAFLLDELIQDGNLPGLRVCRDDWDELDPYRLPARQPDRLDLPFVRPDVPLGTGGVTVSAATAAIATEADDIITTETGEYLEAE
jgi:hypothetical protein